MTSCGNYYTGLGYGYNGVSCAYGGCGGCGGLGCGYRGYGYGGCGGLGCGYGSGYGYGGYGGFGGLGCGHGGWGCGVYGYGGNRPSFCRRYCLYGSY